MQYFEAPAASDEELYMQASKAIAWLVSDKLQETTLRVDSACEYDPDSQPGVFVYDVHPPNLLGWVYHQVAQMLVDRRPMATCPECGRVFTPHDGRQRYCQPKCASRARFLTFKEKQAEKGR